MNSLMRLMNPTSAFIERFPESSFRRLSMPSIERGGSGRSCGLILISQISSGSTMSSALMKSSSGGFFENSPSQ